MTVDADPNDSSAGHGLLRIGALARRTGVSPELLRAWEQRYELLRPVRTEAGYRLYDEDDERRVRRMLRYLARGLAAREAARLVAADERRAGAERQEPLAGADVPRTDELSREFQRSMDQLDERGAQDAIDRLFAAIQPGSATREVLFPFLRDLGDRWAAGTASVADEHFASSIIRARLLGLARGWGAGAGPAAVLACPPREEHDIGLVGFGLELRSHGWRVTFLGADTPLEVIEGAARRVGASRIVLAATDPGLLSDHERAIEHLSRSIQVAVGGPGSTAGAAQRASVMHLDGGVVEAAAQLAGAVRGPAGA